MYFDAGQGTNRVALARSAQAFDSIVEARSPSNPLSFERQRRNPL
jgi:hypothetical protein